MEIKPEEFIEDMDVHKKVIDMIVEHELNKPELKKEIEDKWINDLLYGDYPIGLIK